MQSNQNYRLLGLQVEPILESPWIIGELVPNGLLEDAIGGGSDAVVAQTPRHMREPVIKPAISKKPPSQNWHAKGSMT